MRTKSAKGRDMKHTMIYVGEGMKRLRYHQTDVVSFNDEVVVLNTNGWQTATTKNRVNQGADLFGLSLSCHAEKGEWLITLASGEVTPFSDGMVIPRDKC